MSARRWPLAPNLWTDFLRPGIPAPSDKSTGQVSVWEMNENALIGAGPVSPSPGSSWRAVGLT
jgi:hypothetical protein